MTSYLYKGEKTTFWRFVVGGVGLVVVIMAILWRYDSYYSLKKGEEESRRQVVEYVFYLGKESENVKFGLWCYYFWLPDNSAFSDNSLLEIVGEYTIDGANENYEEKRLVITEINEVPFSFTSALHLRAVTFAFFGQQQRFLAEKLGIFLEKYIESMHAELLIRMLLGDIKNEMVAGKEQTLELKDLMRQSGLSHVLSVSGWHVNLIFAVLEGIMMFIILCIINIYLIITIKTRKNVKNIKTNKLLSTPKELPNMIKKINVLIMIIVLVWYVLLVGTSASIVRATMMMIFKLVDRYFIKVNVDTLFVLFLVSLIMLVFNPFFVYSVSFLLSFSATAGVLVAIRWWRVLKRRKSIQLLSGFFTSLIVMLMTAPILIYFFGEVNLASLISNIILIPLVAPMILGLPMIYVLSFLREMSIMAEILWQPALNLYNMIYKVFFFGLGRWDGTNWAIKIEQNRLQMWHVWVYYLIIGIIIILWQPVINLWQTYQRKKQ